MVSPARRRNSFRRHAALLATVVLALGAGCSNNPQMRVSALPEDPEVAGVCDGIRHEEACRSVTVAERVYRYQLLPAASATSDSPLALVDLGGPGRIVFGARESDARHFTERWRGSHRLIFIEEPWVTEPVTAACAEALRGRQRSLRQPAGASQEEAHSAIVASCRLDDPNRWGFTSSRYAEVADAIAAQEKAALSGVVAASFGARRTARVAERRDVKWLILNSPAARGLDAAGYLKSRHDGVISSLRAACGGCDVQELLSRAQDKLRTPRVLDERSVPVTTIDLGAAAIATAYATPQERNQIVAGLPALEQETASKIGLLSDATLLRFDVEDTSPAALAYLSEVCRAYPGWDRGSTPGEDVVADALATIHAPCSAVRAEPLVDVAQASAATCLASSKADAVTPPSAAQTWRFPPPAHEVLVPDAPHASGDLTDACYEMIFPAETTG
jgi:hypothetical protein